MLSEDKKNIKPDVLRVSKELSGLRLDKFIIDNNVKIIDFLKLDTY